ncbi:MAG TPA: ABC transporter substrate-binding protein [Chloroflexota bacterium]|nr:ABC transporter substrate-binding protein [Chloroflexota bacterium]
MNVRNHFALLAAAVLMAGCSSAAPASSPPATSPSPSVAAAPASAPASTAAKPSAATSAAPAASKPAAGSASPSGAATKLTIAGAQIVPRAGIDVGVAHGYFKQENLDLDIVPLQSAPDQVPLLATGKVDAGITGPSATHFNALAANVPVKFEAPCGESSPDGKVANLTLMLRKELHDNGQVKTVKDLAGRNIAIPSVDSVGYATVGGLLEKAGLTLNDVKLVTPMAFGDMLPALANGKVDAATVTEPFITQSIQKNIAVILSGDNDVMPLRLGCIVMFGQRLVDDKQLGLRFLRAYMRGVRDYYDAFFENKNKPEIVKILVDAYPIKDPSMYDQMLPTYIDPNGKMNLDSLRLDVRFYKQAGLVKADPNIDALVDTSIMQQVISELGTHP